MADDMIELLDGIICRVLRIDTYNGVAGDRMIAAEVAYTYPEIPERDVSWTYFHGNAFGCPGPVLMTSGPACEYSTYVVDAGRFGDKFNREWVRRFFLGPR